MRSSRSINSRKVEVRAGIHVQSGVLEVQAFYARDSIICVQVWAYRCLLGHFPSKHASCGGSQSL